MPSGAQSAVARQAEASLMADYSLKALERYLPELQNLNVQSLGQGAPMVGGSPRLAGCRS